ncbi:hypothetical protein ACFSE0_16820 [Ochrobactrum teleogrylli]|uniref:hypothetical protein n=1 Tax=Ochrobactrum teleogrylli TaxID=2479765 RepID=UPI0026A09335
MPIFTRTGLGLLLSFVLMNGVAAQEHQSVNDANNPLTPKITVNFHNYYVPEYMDYPVGDPISFSCVDWCQRR